MSTTIDPLSGASDPRDRKRGKSGKTRRRAGGRSDSSAARPVVDRKIARKFRKLLELDEPTALHWALPRTAMDSPILKLAATWSKDRSPSPRKVAARLDDWLASLVHRGASLPMSVEALAWAHLLSRLEEHLPPARVGELADQLATIARDAAALEVTRQPVEHQLLAGELPWTLAWLRSDEAVGELRDAARTALAHGIDELLDGDGLPHARDLPSLRLLLACWTRCVWIGDVTGSAVFSGDALLRYEWLVRQVIRLTRRGGSPVLGGDDGTYSAKLVATALKQAGDSADRALAGRVLPHGTRSGKRSSKSADLLDAPEPSCYSQWAGIAVCRSSWKRPDEYLAITFAGPEITGEVSVPKGRLLLGEWQTQLRVHEHPLAIDSEWTELCWHSDDEVDYLELEQTWTGGWKLQRQMLLAREDRLLFLADAVVGPTVAEIDYRLDLPLAESVRFAACDETREGQLVGERPLATVYPLALPEWREGPCRGSLGQFDRHLQLSQAALADRLYAPLLFDLSPRRLDRERTWRQLTVAEKLTIQRPETAVGYRVQIGREQWLVYRSLAEAANRTLLGHNLSHEFLFAQFDTEGEVNALIQVDSE